MSANVAIEGTDTDWIYRNVRFVERRELNVPFGVVFLIKASPTDATRESELSEAIE